MQIFSLLCLILYTTSAPLPSVSAQLGFSIGATGRNLFYNGMELECMCERERDSEHEQHQHQHTIGHRGHEGHREHRGHPRRRLDFEVEVPQRSKRDLIRVARLINGALTGQDQHQQQQKQQQQQQHPKRLMKRYKESIAAHLKQQQHNTKKQHRQRSMLGRGKLWRKKRDIRGEYDLIKKDYKPIDLLQPEVLQFMPEATRPYFKQRSCLFGNDFERAASAAHTDVALGQQQQVPLAAQFQCPYATQQQFDVKSADENATDNNENAELNGLLERLLAAVPAPAPAPRAITLPTNSAPALQELKQSTSTTYNVAAGTQAKLTPNELDRVLESIITNVAPFESKADVPNALRLQQIKEFILAILEHYFEHHRDIVDREFKAKFQSHRLATTKKPATANTTTTSTLAMKRESSSFSDEEELQYDEVFGDSSHLTPFSFSSH